MSEYYRAISLVDNLLETAYSVGASDIHLEPQRDALRVRFRIDGILHERENILSEDAPQVISRIKVLAHMNIAEHRLPQDGTWSFIHKQGEIDLRIATFPCVHGEKVVIRLLDKHSGHLQLDQLGLHNELAQRLRHIAHQATGFFLVTGPTGSGKTTTLHALLTLINAPEKNITTLEEPIEYVIEGINQGHVYPEIGFTFEKGIRSLLRQDPDVIMVGEIRDRETAQVAIQAALTGHLVVSTLHTTDAPGALMRLIDMSIEPFLINAALSGILAQRLVRKLCVACKQETDPTSYEAEYIKKYNLPIERVFTSSGCAACNTIGYKCRIGIFELLEVSHNLRSLITQTPSFDMIYKQAETDGMIPLMNYGAQLVNQGVTTLAELMRVL